MVTISKQNENFLSLSMIFSEETALKVAHQLLEVKAIKLSPEKPFVWASGLLSPIYCDNRVSLSYPEVRSYIRQQLSKVVQQHYLYAEVIVGVATAGIPQGVLVAEELHLPFAYVRSKKKDHGMTNQIEGFTQKGQKALVIEDLVSTGKSSLMAVDALRQQGLEVLGMVSVFNYGLAIAEKNFEQSDCNLISLSDYEHLIKVAIEQDYVSDEALESLKQWRNDPQLWSDKNNVI